MSDHTQDSQTQRIRDISARQVETDLCPRNDEEDSDRTLSVVADNDIDPNQIEI